MSHSILFFILTFSTLMAAAEPLQLLSSSLQASVDPAPSDVPRTPGFEFDCSGREDGDYPHPSKCTHYVSCVAQARAYEMSCGMGPNGKLLYFVQNSGPDPATSKCDYSTEVECEIPSPNE